MGVYMQTWKGFMRSVGLLTLILSLSADASVAADSLTQRILTVSSPTPIEAPPLIAGTFVSETLVLPSLAVSGTNAVVVWHHPSGFPPGAPGDPKYYWTNLFLTRLDQTGQPIVEPPRLVATTYNAAVQPLLVPADFGFFMLYYAATNNAANWAYLCVSINPEGKTLSAPVVLATNSFKYSAAANNGRTLFFAGGPYTTDAGLDFRILGQNGEQISKGVIPGGSQETFAAASDGTDYLVIWRSAAAPYLRATRVLHDGSLSPTVGIPNIVAYQMWLAHGPSGYLAVAGSNILLLDAEGTEIKRAMFPVSPLSHTVVYPDGADWVVFTVPAFGGLQSYRINGTTLAVTANPYAEVGDFASEWGVNMQNMVTPFGPGRFLFDYSINVATLTSAGVGPIARPASYGKQNTSRVVASSFGYAVLWTEDQDGRIHLLRLAKDGTHMDDHSLSFGSGVLTTMQISVFDGVDYVIGWTDLGSSVAHISRIAASGDANVRQQQIIFPSGSGRFSMTVNLNTLYAWQWGGRTDIADLHIFAVSKTGALGPETLVHGEALASDGENLYSIGPITNIIHVWRIEPNAVPAETNDTIVGPGLGGGGVSGRDGFVAMWAPPEGGTAYAYFTNGVEQFAGQSLPLTLQPTAVALNADRLLMAQGIVGQRGDIFYSVDLHTGQTISKQVDLGTALSVNLASAGKDFFGVTDSVGFQASFVGGFWVTEATTPSFAPAQASGGGVKATLTLDPDRHYRIETSADLLNWNLMEMVNGVSAHDVNNSGAQQEFVRAVLVPE